MAEARRVHGVDDSSDTDLRESRTERLMKTLPIIWKRLVSAEGETCVRCGATQTEMQRAVAKLREALGPLGIEPVLEEQVLSLDPPRDRLLSELAEFKAWRPA